jgi:hypothetical protein
MCTASNNKHQNSVLDSNEFLSKSRRAHPLLLLIRDSPDRGMAKVARRLKEASEDPLENSSQKPSKAYGQGQENVKPAGGSALTIAASLAANPWWFFLSAMKSPMTREKYRGRLAKFFDFVGVEGSSMPERARTFVKISKNDRAQLFDAMLQFAQMQR